ncbi:MAG: hypothetical protein KC910_28015 [Candidatus Eremiobacteraeota bacterium]|nr:hypothetical protein [Candidatus Eremiobacteraeota bacterium]
MRHWKTASLWLNLTAFALFLVGTVLVYLFPSQLAGLGLTPVMGKIVLLQLISFILLLGAFQTWLGDGWRRASLAASFIVLGESMMIAVLFPTIPS